MCLVLTGIHAYLGVHVLSREVVFVDIALAQIAALGATAAFLAGYETDTWESYVSGLSATLLGALVLSLTRSRRRHVSQEAVIGVVYAVSSAAAVLLSDRAAHGAEQVRTMLVGNLLAVRPPEVAQVGALYAAIGVFHWLCRRPFFLISTDPDAAFRDGWRVRLWDFLFYASFGVVVTSSVRIAGVLLVFSYLIVPALAGIMLGRTIRSKLLIGWGFGTLVSVLGMVASAGLDLPTGATVVCAFGLTLVALSVVFYTLQPRRGASRPPDEPAAGPGHPRLRDARRRLREPAAPEGDRGPCEPRGDVARQDDGAHGKRTGPPDDSGRRLVSRDPLRRADVQGDRRRDQRDWSGADPLRGHRGQWHRDTPRERRQARAEAPPPWRRGGGPAHPRAVASAAS